jgi:hypothetical protein
MYNKRWDYRRRMVMKKRLRFLMCICAVVFVLGGCGVSKKNTSSNEVVVTKSLEKSYVERINAYLEYYQKEEAARDEYTIGAVVSLDSDNLPILWLAYAEVEEDEDESETSGYIQVLDYEEGKVTILAETGHLSDISEIYPILSTQALALKGKVAGNDSIYTYDEEKGEISLLMDDDSFNECLGAMGIETYLKNVEEKPDIYNFSWTSYSYLITESNQIIYCGKTVDFGFPCYYFRRVCENNTAVQEFYERYSKKAGGWKNLLKSMLKNKGTEDDYYCSGYADIIWSFPNNENNLEYEDVYEYAKKTYQVTDKSSDIGVAQWMTGMDVETKLRYFAKHPIYTTDELWLDFMTEYMSKRSDTDYEIVDVNSILKGAEEYKKAKPDYPDWVCKYDKELDYTDSEGIFVDLEGVEAPLYIIRKKDEYSDFYELHCYYIDSEKDIREESSDPEYDYHLAEIYYKNSLKELECIYKDEDDSEYSIYYQLKNGELKEIGRAYDDDYFGYSIGDEKEEVDFDEYLEYIESFGSYDNTITSDDCIYNGIDEAYKAYSSK